MPGLTVKRRRTAILGGAAIVLCTLLVYTFANGIPSSLRKNSHDDTVSDLNRTLTNDMSWSRGTVAMDSTITRYMRKWELNGAALAVCRNDSLLYCKGYGWEDDSLGVRMRPGSLMRLASISKLLTATGIMILCERDSLSLDSKVFGEGGILSEYNGSIRDRRYRSITVEHLLRHSSGLSSRRGDPMFSGVWFPSRQNLVENTLHRYLAFSPGTGSEYSNFGYLLLSMIIEKITGCDYEEWMQREVLSPAGCNDMHIAYNTYEERYPGECRYNDYGNNDIRMLSGAGAWVGSVAELARLVASIDGGGVIKDIISKESFERMTVATDAVKYGIGWIDITPEGEMTRSGTLSSTTALIKVFPDSQIWIFVSNSGCWRGPRFSKYTASLLKDCRRRYSDEFLKQDLFAF